MTENKPGGATAAERRRSRIIMAVAAAAAAFPLFPLLCGRASVPATGGQASVPATEQAPQTEQEWIAKQRKQINESAAALASTKRERELRWTDVIDAWKARACSVTRVEEKEGAVVKTCRRCTADKELERAVAAEADLATRLEKYGGLPSLRRGVDVCE